MMAQIHSQTGKSGPPIVAHDAVTRTKVEHIRVLSFLVLGIIAIFSFVKGFNGAVQDWGQPYWILDYSQGFIKRGLIGQMFGWMAPSTSLAQKWDTVLQVHLVSSGLLVTGLIFWCWQLSIDRTLGLVIGLFVSSQFLPTLAYNTGFLDVYLYALLLGSMFSVARGSLMPAIILGFVGPFIHESYLFPWLTLPLLLVHGTLGPSINKQVKSVLVVASPIAASIAVSVLHSPSVARDMIAKLPLPDEVTSGLMKYQFGQTILSSLSIMAGKMVSSSWCFLISLIFFGFPTILMIFIFTNSRALTIREKTLIWLASCAPMAIIGMAWDLSRFIVMTNLCALFSILFVEMAWRPQRKALSRSMVVFVCGITAVYLASPFVYTYFEVAYEFRPDWLPLRPILRWIFSLVYKN